MKWITSTFDRVLLGWYGLFAFVALIFEPLYYFGCDWNGKICPLATESSLIFYTKEIWLFYAQWDPLFYNIPLWLRVLCSIEVFIFGPLYLVVVIGLINDSSWLFPVTLLFSGALVYSTIVYFLMEIIEFLPGTNLLMVFIVNIPWTIVPILLTGRILMKVNKRTRKQD